MAIIDTITVEADNLGGGFVRGYSRTGGLGVATPDTVQGVDLEFFTYNSGTDVFSFEVIGTTLSDTFFDSVVITNVTDSVPEGEYLAVDASITGIGNKAWNWANASGTMEIGKTYQWDFMKAGVVNPKTPNMIEAPLFTFTSV